MNLKSHIKLIETIHFLTIGDKFVIERDIDLGDAIAIMFGDGHTFEARTALKTLAMTGRCVYSRYNDCDTPYVSTQDFVFLSVDNPDGTITF